MNTAKIVAITNPLVDGVKSADEFIAYTARVSNPSNQMNSETAEKLLRYCIRNKHFSIFEMVNIVMEVTTTRIYGNINNFVYISIGDFNESLRRAYQSLENTLWRNT